MSFHIPIRRGEEHPLAKLSNATRHQCRREYQSGRTVTDLARFHGVDRKTMTRIVHQPGDWLPPETEIG